MQKNRVKMWNWRCGTGDSHVGILARLLYTSLLVEIFANVPAINTKFLFPSYRWRMRTLFRSILGWLMLNEVDEASLARSWTCYQHHDPSTLSHWFNDQQASEAHGLVRAVRMRLRQFSFANDPLTNELGLLHLSIGDVS